MDQNDTGTEAPRTEAPRTFIGRFIDELVPDWRPTREQVLWATRLTVAVILALTVIAVLGGVLWVVLSIYINPRTATERKDLVQSFAIVVAGAVGSLSALAAVGNLYVSRRNLQQQRELELERAQEDALPAYLDQMIQLLSDEQTPLSQAKGSDEVSILARVRTLTVLPRLDGNRKASVVQFLYEAGLISSASSVLDLSGADLQGANLQRANLQRANLQGSNLQGANLSNAFLGKARLIGATLNDANLSNAKLFDASLSGANLSGATLRKAHLSTADLSNADLSSADLSEARLRATILTTANLSDGNLRKVDLVGAKGVTDEQLARARFLEGATMPNGQKYEDWIKSKHREEGGKNDGSS